MIFKKQKFNLRVLLSICLIFGQFQPGVASKSFAYKSVAYISTDHYILLNISFIFNRMSNIYIFVNMETQDTVWINDVANCFCEVVWKKLSSFFVGVFHEV